MKKSKGKRERLKQERDIQDRITCEKVAIQNSKNQEVVGEALQAKDGSVYLVCDGAIIPRKFEVSKC